MRTLKLFIILASLILVIRTDAKADERFFTYSYESSVLPENQFEIEQWITNQNGRKEGDYSRWDLRTEIEYGVTSFYSTALYLNWESTRIDGTEEDDDNSTEFKGVSWENIYQLLNPTLDPVGLATYLELTSDGLDYEVEGKLILSKEIDNFVLATNAIYEAEWEREDGHTEREATLEFTFGAAYKLDSHWSVGLEARNKGAYPDGLNLSGQEFQTWSAGPNVHYGTSKWWATLTVLPQIWGNGDGASGDRQLVHEEELEVRLIFGILL